MPNTLSAKKRLRQNEKRRERNRATKNTVKTFIKRFEVAVASGDAEASKTEFRAAVRRLDQAAARGVIHKNKASHEKSRLQRHLDAVVGTASVAAVDDAPAVDTPESAGDAAPDAS